MKKEGGSKWVCSDPGEEVVISGIAGVFPDSDNVRHFGENLLAKNDLVSDDERRWKPDNPEIPQRMGKLNEITKFDTAFFGISEKQTEVMDPMGRMLLEKTYEAVIDAGYNPKEFKGTRTGVFIGTSIGATESAIMANRDLWNAHTIPGMVLAMLANRISFWLDVNGPSYALDTACSSSSYALEQAYKAIKAGDCDSAIVGGCNLCLQPILSYLFTKLGVINHEGRCKSFDESANGYCRAECVCVIVVQKMKDARRMYARLVHAKTNCDGRKEEGIHFPSTKMQSRLLEEFYEECEVNPADLQFLEAHATGTVVGDPQELQAIEQVFLPGRTESLRIGSIKSNMGHSEAASGLCSIAKLILSYETGFIMPNINLNKPRSDIESLHNGKLTVVTEPTPWNGGLAAVNSFGFGGANCHLLFESNPKIRKNNGSQDSAKTKMSNGLTNGNGFHHDELPYLVTVSGRTEEAVDVMLSDIESRPLDKEYIGLFHKIHEEDIFSHNYRGFMLLKENKEHVKSIQHFTGEDVPIFFVYSGMGSQWPTMGGSLMKIPMFAESIYGCHRALISKDMDLIKIISVEDDKIFDNIMNAYVGIVAIQIALTDILSALNIKPDRFLGHSVGEIACAYADGCVTAEQAMHIAYYRGLALLQTELPEGLMAAIGLGHSEVVDMVPSEIDIGCHNGPSSCTISGPKEAVRNFIKSLQQKNIFAKEVQSSGLALHSRYISEAGSKFLEYVKNMKLKSKFRSEKWISTTYLEDDWDTETAKNLSEYYFMTNMIGTVYFQEALQHVPDNAMVIEIAPHGLLQAILKRSLKKSNVNIPLTSRNHSDNGEHFLCAVGRIFEAGANPHISKFYPPVEFPVSKGTPMISPLVKWNHKRDWPVYKYNSKSNFKFGQRTVYVFLNDEQNKYLYGHIISGKNAYPATGYLVLAWETFSFILGRSALEVPVVIRDVKLLRMTHVPKEGNIEFLVTIHKDRNEFEINENGDTVVIGKIYERDTDSNDLLEPKEVVTDEMAPITTDDVYTELKSVGNDYRGIFRAIKRLNMEATRGRLAWSGNFVCFIDALLQIYGFIDGNQRGRMPISIKKIIIDPKKHFEMLNAVEGDEKELPSYGYRDLEIINSGGIQIEKVSFIPTKKKYYYQELAIGKICFVPYINAQFDDFRQMVRVVSQITFENLLSTGLRSIEIIDNFTNSKGPLITELLLDSFKDIPLVQVNAAIIADPDNPLIQDKFKELTQQVKEMPGDESCSLIIASHVLNRKEVLQNCLDSLKKRAFLLTIESSTEIFDFDKLNLTVCFECVLNDERVLLLRKAVKNYFEPAIIKIDSNSYSWLPDVQNCVNQSQNFILYAEKDPFNGILGFFRCIQAEKKKQNIRCFFILDKSAPDFSPSHPFYKTQLDKELLMNIYKDGAWGTYADLILENISKISTYHAYVNTLVRGDLTSLQWIKGPVNPITYQPPKNKTLIHVYYASLNFRDVMLATGRLSYDDVQQDKSEFDRYFKKDISLGLEFVGRNKDGRRYMGFVRGNAMSNLVECNEDELFPVPDNWSMEEAATVSLVYGTALYALFIRAHMKRGESVLIHSGAGGVGQAAINICLHYGCNIFTTVGSSQKRDFIRKTFPSIPESHIGSSRDESFEIMVKRETNGKGVDIVLNSLSEEKLIASIHCLAYRGRFLEVGKFDMSMDNSIGMKYFFREISFHGIDLAGIMFDKDSNGEFRSLMANGLKMGFIKPLIRTVFGREQVESAFRYMVSGEHIGKVIIKIRDEEPDRLAKPIPILMNAIPKYICNPQKTYVLCGGLGGIGIELVEWLIGRGARYILLTCRNGSINARRHKKVIKWQSFGIKVTVCANDISNENEVRHVLNTANSMAPVGSIYNLAAVLNDDLLENHSEETFAACAAPKSRGTVHLDKLSRELCPELEEFVVFSSVACGLGNAGQSNYGMANSVMERIIEKRKSDNLPALAIQWGAVADVGILAEMGSDVTIAGTLQQDIATLMEILDKFLNQSYPVVRSMSVAEKLYTKQRSLLDMVCHILGIKDIKSVNYNSKLGDLGVDSMSGLEIRNLLEKNYEIFLQPKEIRDITFAKLREIEINAGSCGTKSVDTRKKDEDFSIGELGFEYFSAIMNADLSFLSVPDKLIRLPSLLDNQDRIETSTQKPPTLFVLPGTDGIPQFMELLSVNLEAEVFCLLYNSEDPHKTIETFAEEMVTQITNALTVDEQFYIIGFSFGGFVAMEVVRKLEKQGRTGRLWLLDVSPKIWEEYKWPSVDGVNYAATNDSSSVESVPNVEKQRAALLSIMDGHLQAAKTYFKESHQTLKTITSLIRPEKSLQDYGLSEYFENQIAVHLIEGNHYSLLKKKETADIIMKELKLFKNSLQIQS